MREILIYLLLVKMSTGPKKISSLSENQLGLQFKLIKKPIIILFCQ